MDILLLMKHYLRWVLVSLLLSVAPISGQPSSTTARHIIASGTLPATCRPNTGDVYMLTAPGPTAQFYQCTAVNTWTAVPTSGVASPANSIQFNNAGVFGGITGSSFDGTNLDILFAGGEFYLPGTGNTGDSIQLSGIRPIALITSPGTAGNDMIFFGSAGGQTNIVTTGVGGNAGAMSLTGGAGGIAPSALTASTGGDGSTIDLTSGTGGPASVTGTGINTGGVGGSVFIRASPGGAAANGSMNTGGNAGKAVIQLNLGGTGSTANGANGEFDVNGASTVFKVTYAGGITASALPTSAGAGGLFVCVDNTGVLYKKATCP